MNNVPADLMIAIDHAFRILDWYEELGEDEVPPEWMWLFEDELTEWFEDVKQARKDKYDPDNRDDRTEVPMMDNEFAGGRG